MLRTLVHHVPPFSAGTVATAISWGAIITELALVVGFLVPRLFLPTIWLGLSYHTVLVLTTQRTFGMFWYLTAVSYLAFVAWPTPATVAFDPVRRPHRALRALLSRLDVGGALSWAPGKGPLSVRTADGERSGVRAVLPTVARVPAVALLAMAVIALPDARWDYAAAAGVLVLLVVVALAHLGDLRQSAAVTSSRQSPRPRGVR